MNAKLAAGSKRTASTTIIRWTSRTFQAVGCAGAQAAHPGTKPQLSPRALSILLAIRSPRPQGFRPPPLPRLLLRLPSRLLHSDLGERLWREGTSLGACYSSNPLHFQAKTSFSSAFERKVSKQKLRIRLRKQGNVFHEGTLTEAMTQRREASR